MRSPFYVFAFFLAVSPACAESNWLDLFSASLREVKRQQQSAAQKLDVLGKPMTGQTAQELGYMHGHNPPTETISRWVQVDLQQSYPIDQIALVPVQMDWNPGEPAVYGFPKRFRVDISDDPEFLLCQPVGVFTDADYEEVGIAPLVLPTHGKTGRYVRVTVFSSGGFVLTELMVISGNKNVAIGCPVNATHSVMAWPRWDSKNLVDGRTPLGPPVMIDSEVREGLYAGPSLDESSTWMGFDLKDVFPIEEVRLYPIHSRGNSDIPGHGFPRQFRLEASLEPHFSEPFEIPVGEISNLGNPGDNPVTIRADGKRARYLRIILIKAGALIHSARFGLSEMEVYSGGVNVARTAEALATVDPAPGRNYSKSLLNDGFTNYGRIISLSVWLDHWRQRSDLLSEQKVLEGRKVELTAQATKRAGFSGMTIVGLLTIGGVMFLWKTSHVRKREMERFRRQIANDLHDEIGSNLAAIEMMSETSAKHQEMAAGYSPKINRIARETTRAMRETLWLAGFREEAENDFMEQLQLTAARILAGREFEWLAVVPALPEKWSPDKQRQIFLFFKEALTNAVRHSKATLVQLSVKVEGTQFELVIKDNGRGFSVDAVKRGVGMQSLKERAATSGGIMKIESSPGDGTVISLRTSLVG